MKVDPISPSEGFGTAAKGETPAPKKRKKPDNSEVIILEGGIRDTYRPDGSIKEETPKPIFSGQG